MKPNFGTLSIVATPIGNLKDITLRAIETLKNVDLIACEDTRKTQKLTSRYEIKTPLTSYFGYNKIKKGQYLLKLLKEGKDIALVSEAGTPGISDPGFHLINLAIENDVALTVLPGPVGLIAALVLSGMPTNKFIFEGFLSSKGAARRKRLREFLKEKRTVIIYESPHRILSMLEYILEVLGDRPIALARELTKKSEEVRRGNVSALLEHFKKTAPRGEFIVIIGKG